MQRGSEFMSAEQLFRKISVRDLKVVKVAPPSALCKRLCEKTNHHKMGDIHAVALTAFGTTDAKHVEVVQKWFAHYRLQQFAKAEEHLKRRFGMVALGVKGEVERLLRQARGCLRMNEQCTVASLKPLLIYLDLSCSTREVEIMQRVYGHSDSLDLTWVCLPLLQFSLRNPWPRKMKLTMRTLIVFTASVVMHVMGMTFSFVTMHILAQLVGINCA